MCNTTATSYNEPIVAKNANFMHFSHLDNIMIALFSALFFLATPTIGTIQSQQIFAQTEIFDSSNQTATDSLTQETYQFSEAITYFSSTITVNQDTSISIQEKIEYVTQQTKHGIFRYIPLSYNHDGFKKQLPISEISVTDEANNPIPYRQTIENNSVFLKIGDPFTTFTGKKTYLISYTVQRALLLQDSMPLLYWDITGEGWNMPILQTTATVVSPRAEILQTNCFSGQIGGNDELCIVESKSAGTTGTDQNSTTISYLDTVQYNDNVTLSVDFDSSNSLQFPSATQNLYYFFSQNWMLIFLPAPLFMMALIWWYKGRDWRFVSANVYTLDPTKPQKLSFPSVIPREPFVYAPIEALSPGQAAALIHNKVTPEGILAEILELARKKYLKIEAVAPKSTIGKLLGKKNDYTFIKLKELSKNPAVSPVQEHLFKKIFASKNTTKVSELKGTFYLAMQTAQKILESSLTSEHFYTSNPTNSRVSWIFFYCIITGGLFTGVIWQFAELSIVWPYAILAAQILPGLFLAYHMPQRTAVGTNLWLQARGLRKSIRYGKWREKIKEKHLFIEEVFPFAVALGVVDALAKDMEQLNITPPDYLGTTSLVGWNAATFANSFTKEITSSLSHNPSSSSSSGGFSSGGSSGGGGGGGGGGSW